jgi:heme/copper-type cytochrome/quinol oxidase subunit 3
MAISQKNYQQHPFHLVDPRPWPLVASTAAGTILCGAVMWFHGYNGGGATLAFGMLGVLFVMYAWWRDIIREATFEGQHTSMVQLRMRFGIILFIASEVMFFFAFFWAFFHSSMNPVPELGSVWPPKGVEAIDAWGFPFLNTVLLLSSGATCTWRHHAILSGDMPGARISLIFTIILAAIFTGVQALEYCTASFTISDSVFGSTFYIATGFHGFHVFIGTTFLTVCLFRLISNHFSQQHHFGFEAAAWYWHFVDVVWLFLFVAVYWWGGA